jgi:hypothetical protein
VSVHARRITRTTLLATLVALAGLLAMALAGWPGETNGCFEQQRPVCFCEAPRAGLVAQPSNTLSNLGFIVVGLAIAIAADRRSGWFATRRNPLTSDANHVAIFAVVTALLGPGSMALHASLTRWGGHIDVSSMYLYAGLLIAYGGARWFRLSASGFAGVYAVIVAALIATKLLDVVSVELLFGLLLTATAVIEGLLSLRRPLVTIRRRWGAAALVLFLAAFAIWIPSLSGGALCDPDSWVQGHAIWHLLCAAAAGCLFLYFLSEDTSISRVVPGVS